FIIIIGLVSWLLADFVQNKVQVDNASVSILQPKLSKPVIDFPPPIQPKNDQNDWNVIWGYKTEEVKVQPTTPPKPNFILTGTLIEPTSSKAFILIPTRNNDEIVCIIGDKIDEWEVIAIASKEVKLKNSQSEILVLRIQQSWSTPSSSKQIEEVLTKLPPIPPALKNALEEGGNISVPVEQVKSYIELTVQSFGQAYIKQMVKEFTDIPENDMPTDENKLVDYLSNLFRVYRGESPGNLPLENILFAANVNADNSPISPMISFKPGDRQIYACFTNQGLLAGISKLIHRWTNKNTGEIIKLETKPIDSNAPFNFIWVRKTDGWQIGEYKVELFNTETVEKIAEGNFSIAP
ncbi:MAG: hypothetical protein V1709_10535, partial [Planctomycetota bacterium]